VCILTIIPWASVIGIQEPGLLRAAREFQHSVALVIISALILQLIYQIYNKPLTQEMKEEEIKESDQKDKKQLLFKPTIGFSIFFIFFIVMSVIAIIIQLTGNNTDFGLIIVIIGFMVFWLWLWYLQPVFIFAEDSVQIKSHLFYLLGIGRKTVIRFADITSVGPNMKGNYGWGVEHKHSLMISMNGTTKGYGLGCYNDEKIAKIWLRFKEKLGDKVAIP
jgi:hypothetical protein